jgi:hypothetical protein
MPGPDGITDVDGAAGTPTVDDPGAVLGSKCRTRADESHTPATAIAIAIAIAPPPTTAIVLLRPVNVGRFVLPSPVWVVDWVSAVLDGSGCGDSPVAESPADSTILAILSTSAFDERGA